jgi:hypothetical protein
VPLLHLVDDSGAPHAAAGILALLAVDSPVARSWFRMAATTRCWAISIVLILEIPEELLRASA